MRQQLQLLAVFLLAVSMAFAQTAGTIQGTVSDDTGAVIPGATILVIGVETGVEHTTTTNEVGFFSVPGLSQGL